MVTMEKLVIATGNPGKKERYGKLLAGVVGEVLGLSDFAFKTKPAETGATAEENARIKALFYLKKTKLPVFAEDESLFVDFLPADNQPGACVRRVGGRELSDDELLAHWDSLVSKAPQEKRTGRWHIAYCFASPEGPINLTTIDYPRIFFSPPSKVQIPGWPMSSIQGPNEFGKPHSELDGDELREFNEQTDTILVAKLAELFGDD